MKKSIVVALMVVFSVFAVGAAFASHHMTADGKLTLDKPIDKWPAAKIKEGKKAKNPVTFNHTKHGADLGCTVCHHSEADKALKAGGTPAKLCFDCHGSVAKDKQVNTYEMIHAKTGRCITCHKTDAKAMAAKAPTKCKECHGGADE